MAEIQKKLCPACGQANDYSDAVCSFCAMPFLEGDESQQSLASAESNPPEKPLERSSFGITTQELQAIAAQERSAIATPTHNRKEIRVVLLVLVITPLVVLLLLGLFGGFAKLSDIWRMSG